MSACVSGWEAIVAMREDVRAKGFSYVKAKGFGGRSGVLLS